MTNVENIVLFSAIGVEDVVMIELCDRVDVVTLAPLLSNQISLIRGSMVK